MLTWAEAYWFLQAKPGPSIYNKSIILMYIMGKIDRHGNTRCHLRVEDTKHEALNKWLHFQNQSSISSFRWFKKPQAPHVHGLMWHLTGVSVSFVVIFNLYANSLDRLELSQAKPLFLVSPPLQSHHRLVIDKGRLWPSHTESQESILCEVCQVPTQSPWQLGVTWD